MWYIKGLIEGREWEEAGRTKKTSFMVRGLKSNTKYEFQVIALSTSRMSVADHVESRCVRIGYCKTGGVTVICCGDVNKDRRGQLFAVGMYKNWRGLWFESVSEKWDRYGVLYF